MKNYTPYPKQKLFHKQGSKNRERLLCASNQSGKSYCGSMELAIHLTGQYPSWWEGRVWNRPIRAWAASETSEVTRDTIQRLLIGEPKDRSLWGTGAIPHDCLPDFNQGVGDKGWTSGGVSDALGTLLIQHTSGSHSTLGFKNYTQQRQRWQGETLDLIYFDEEPPEDIYMEGLTRTNATEGMTFITFTPLKGYTEVVEMFFREAGLME